MIPAIPHRLVPLLAALALASTAQAQRQMEQLDRGVVAVRRSSTEAFVSWRLLGLEDADLGFNLYRSAAGGPWTKLNPSPMTGGTNHVDTTADLSLANSYRVHPVVDGVEQPADGQWTLPADSAAEPLFRIPLQRPTERKIHNVWVGDMDGDGSFEYVVLWVRTLEGQSQILQTYRRDGTLLWEMDFGPNSVDPSNIYPNAAAVAAGQMDGVTVHDLDGDGRAEVIAKSANGVTFGDGTTLHYGDDLTQFLSVLDGLTGAEKARTLLPNPWNDSAGRALGTQFGIGHADGQRPSLFIHAKNRNQDLSFNIINSCWDFRDGAITQRWSIQWDGPVAPEAGHQIRVVDLDGDGRDELFPGVHAVDDDGTLMFDMGDWGVKHGDRWQVGDIDPNRPGQEIYGVQQNHSGGLKEFVADAVTGLPIWTYEVPGTVTDVGRGSVVDLDPRHPGMECWAFDGIRSATGSLVSEDYPWPNLTVWWDDDLLGENLNENIIEKWRYQSESTGRVLTCYHYGSARANSRNVTPFYGDIIGDWREEIIFEGGADREWLLVFTTTTPTNHRLRSLTHNPAYRNGLTVKGYLQQNIPDFFLGEGMAEPPAPDIVYTPLQAQPHPVPTGLNAIASSDREVALTWTATPGALHYEVKRANSLGGPAIAIASGLSEPRFDDAGLSPDTEYFYRVRAIFADGESPDSAEAWVRTAPPVGTVEPTAQRDGTGLEGAVADAAGVILRTGDFDLQGGNAIALLLTAEGLTDDANFTGFSATFAGQPMELLSVNHTAQSATVFHLIDPTATSGEIEVSTGAGVTADLAYSLIALRNVSAVAGMDSIRSTSNSTSTPLEVRYSTDADAGYVVAAAANADYNNARRLSLAHGNPVTSLFGHQVVGSSGHLHVHGGVPTTGGHTDGYLGQYTRTAIATVAFESSVIDEVPLTPEEEWRLQHFGTTENTGDAADDADPDGDRTPNWAERELALDPLDPNSAFRVSIEITGPSSALLQWPNAPGVTFVVQSSTTLAAPWSTEATILGGDSAAPLRHPVATDGPAEFYRIEIPEPGTP